MRHLLAITATLTLIAAPLHAESFKRITTEADYVANVVGKKYCNKSGCWTAKKNGKMTGKFGKDSFRASWKWHKGFSCRAGKLGGKDIGTDCQLIEIAGDKLRITRKQGKGRKVVYQTK
jgi:hypothetical protein